VRRPLAKLLITAVMTTFFSGTAAEHGIALPGADFHLSGQSSGASPLVEKAHGFHCRPVLGWDPRAGAYHLHSHPGICKDYQGCWRQSQNCIFLLGRGWGGWELDRWGWDNWRYYACMMRTGCY
jgi:hypothetical protein